MSESVIKSGRKQSFTVLYKSAIEDKRLPLDARGLLAIMVGLPDGWQYSVKGLAAYVGVSKDTIRRLLEKLEDVGYLTREQTHDESGRFAGNVYVLQDEARGDQGAAGESHQGQPKESRCNRCGDEAHSPQVGQTVGRAARGETRNAAQGHHVQLADRL